MDNLNKDENKEKVIRRLRKIEGQVKGIQRMVDEGKFCGDVLIQVAAARAALNKVGGLILENYMKTCFIDSLEEDKEDSIEKMIDIMVKYTK